MEITTQVYLYGINIGLILGAVFAMIIYELFKKDGGNKNGN